MFGCICTQSGHKIIWIWPKLHANLTKQFHIFHYGCMDLNLLWFLASCALGQLFKYGNIQNDVFPILIDEFNIYLFFKKRGGGYWRSALVRRNMVIVCKKNKNNRPSWYYNKHNNHCCKTDFCESILGYYWSPYCCFIHVYNFKEIFENINHQANWHVFLFFFLQEHIFNLMKSDSYNRYLRSEMYKEFLGGTKKKVPIFPFHFPSMSKGEDWGIEGL